MLSLVEIEDSLASGNMSNIDAIKYVVDVSTRYYTYEKFAKDAGDTAITNVSKSFFEYVKKLYVKCGSRLTPEQKNELKSHKVLPKEIIKDSNLEGVIKANDEIQSKALKLRVSSKANKKADDIASDTVELFKKLDNYLYIQPDGKMVYVDANQIMNVIGALKNNIFDLGLMAKNGGHIQSVSYENYLDNMSSVFRQKTTDSRKAIADFQVKTFECNLPKIKELLQSSISTRERNELIKKFTTEASLYMHSVLLADSNDVSNVEHIMQEIDTIFKSVHTMGVEEGLKRREDEQAHKTIIRQKIKDQVSHEVMWYIRISDFGDMLPAMEVQKLADSIIENNLDSEIFQNATADAIQKLLDEGEIAKYEIADVVNNTIESVVNNVVPELVEKIDEEVSNKNSKIQVDRLLRIDLDTVKVTKTKTQIEEDVKWVIASQVITDLVTNENNNSDAVKAVNSTLSLLACDNGITVQKTDGSQERMQSLLRRALEKNLNSAEIEKEIVVTSPELTGIMNQFDVTREVLGNNFINRVLSIVQSKNPRIVNNVTDEVLANADRAVSVEEVENVSAESTDRQQPLTNTEVEKAINKQQPVIEYKKESHYVTTLSKSVQSVMGQISLGLLSQDSTFVELSQELDERLAKLKNETDARLEKMFHEREGSVERLLQESSERLVDLKEDVYLTSESRLSSLRESLEQRTDINMSILREDSSIEM